NVLTEECKRRSRECRLTKSKQSRRIQEDPSKMKRCCEHGTESKLTSVYSSDEGILRYNGELKKLYLQRDLKKKVSLIEKDDRITSVISPQINIFDKDIDSTIPKRFINKDMVFITILRNGAELGSLQNDFCLVVCMRENKIQFEIKEFASTRPQNLNKAKIETIGFSDLENVSNKTSERVTVQGHGDTMTLGWIQRAMCTKKDENAKVFVSEYSVRLTLRVNHCDFKHSDYLPIPKPPEKWTLDEENIYPAELNDLEWNLLQPGTKITYRKRELNLSSLLTENEQLLPTPLLRSKSNRHDERDAARIQKMVLLLVFQDSNLSLNVYVRTLPTKEENTENEEISREVRRERRRRRRRRRRIRNRGRENEEIGEEEGEVRRGRRRRRSRREERNTENKEEKKEEETDENEVKEENEENKEEKDENDENEENTETKEEKNKKEENEENMENKEENDGNEENEENKENKENKEEKNENEENTESKEEKKVKEENEENKEEKNENEENNESKEEKKVKAENGENTENKEKKEENEENEENTENKEEEKKKKTKRENEEKEEKKEENDENEEEENDENTENKEEKDENEGKSENKEEKMENEENTENKEEKKVEENTDEKEKEENEENNEEKKEEKKEIEENTENKEENDENEEKEEKKKAKISEASLFIALSPRNNIESRWCMYIYCADIRGADPQYVYRFYATRIRNKINASLHSIVNIFIGSIK
ncbi:hypothetical protein L9F63_011823, partial [Diploptera punctata]